MGSISTLIYSSELILCMYHHQGIIVGDVYFELGKIDILKRSQGHAAEIVYMANSIPLKFRRNVWSHRDLNDIFTLMKEENLSRNTYHS